MYVYTTHMHACVLGSQEQAADPLNLELPKAVWHLWVLGTETPSS